MLFAPVPFEMECRITLGTDGSPAHGQQVAGGFSVEPKYGHGQNPLKSGITRMRPDEPRKYLQKWGKLD